MRDVHYMCLSNTKALVFCKFTRTEVWQLNLKLKWINVPHDDLSFNLNKSGSVV